MVVVPAVILWLHQTPDTLLRVGSPWEAIAEVAFWSAPALALCAFGLRHWSTLILGGVAATAALSAQWWSSSTDWHSTASIGPMMVGWMLLPGALLVLRALELRVERGGPRSAMPQDPQLPSDNDPGCR
jgi:hypothetical protein